MSEILYVLLPNGRQQFLDANGDPLASGSVGMYVPGTLDDKLTWQDPYGNAENENPVPLDAAGSALIYGVGQYRQIVKDSAGVQIWDALTYGENPSGGGGGSSGFGAQEDLASAATSDLGSITTHNALITGNALIASFGDSASLSAPIYYFEFDSTATLVYDPVQLILPGAADWKAQAGDAGLAEYLGDGNWKVICLWPAHGGNFGAQKSTAAAATVDIGAIGNNVLLTGAVGPLASLGSSASISQPIYLLEFASAGLTLTNSASLALPSSADILTEAGDTALAEYRGGGAWKLRNYFRKSGEALIVTQVIQRTFVATANGAFDFTLPDSVTPTTRIKFTLCGPAGGGGGCGAGNVGGGGGGGAGGFWSGVLYGFAGGAHITGSVGAVGGTGGVNAAGAAGANPTQFTYNAVNVVVCSPGNGGAKGTTAAGNAGGTGGAVTINTTGLTLEATIANQSNPGFNGVYASSDVNMGGAGASTPIGDGAPSIIYGSGGAGLSGASGSGYGAGGCGAVGSTTAQGGNGSPGYFMMELLA